MEVNITSQSSQNSIPPSASNDLSSPSSSPVNSKKEKSSSNLKVISILISLLLVAILVRLVLLNIFEPSLVEDKLYSCGGEAKICPSGDVAEKKGSKCEFSKCPGSKIDVTNIWELKKSSSETNRVYENSMFNFSFEAPRDWQFKGREKSFELFSPNYSASDDGFSTTYKGSQVTYNTSDVITSNIGIEEWFSANEKNTDAARFSKYNKINTKIAGVDAIELTSEFEDSRYKTYLFLHNGVVNSLKFTSYEKNSREKYQSVFDQILSSFKFTNQDPTFDPSTWETYSNSKWDYSFKYPSTWQDLSKDNDLAKFSSNGENNSALNDDDIYLEVDLKPRDKILGCGDEEIQYFTKKTIYNIGDGKNTSIYKFSIDPAKNPDSKLYSTVYRLHQFIGNEDRCYKFEFQTSDSKTSEKYDLLMDSVISSFYTTVTQGSRVVHLNSGNQDFYFLAPQGSTVNNKERYSEVGTKGSRYQVFITNEPEKYCNENYGFYGYNDNIEISKRDAYKNNICTNDGYKNLSPQSIQINRKRDNQVVGIIIKKTYPNEIISTQEKEDFLRNGMFINELRADSDIIAK